MRLTHQNHEANITVSLDQTTLDVYRSKADDYQQMTDTLDHSELAALLKQLPAGGRVLDAGAGPGHHSRMMQEAGFDVVALEPVAEFADLIEKAGVNTVRAGFDWITQSAEFDGIWASFSLLHVSRDDFNKYLKNIRTALKPDGILVLGMKTGAGESRDSLGRFYCFYTEEELVTTLESLAFNVISKKSGKAEGLAGTYDPFIYLSAKAEAHVV